MLESSVQMTSCCSFLASSSIKRCLSAGSHRSSGHGDGAKGQCRLIGDGSAGYRQSTLIEGRLSSQTSLLSASGSPPAGVTRPPSLFYFQRYVSALATFKKKQVELRRLVYAKKKVEDGIARYMLEMDVSIDVSGFEDEEGTFAKICRLRGTKDGPRSVSNLANILPAFGRQQSSRID